MKNAPNFIKSIQNNKQKGITLVALVVTIVLLIILAMITINMMIREDTILLAKEVANKTEQAAENETIALNALTEKIQEITSANKKNETGENIIPEIDIGEIATENSTINGEKWSYKNPVIPKGFKAIETDQDSTITSNAIWNSETGHENGLVIEDSTGDSQTNGSQFVWIPVPNYDDFHAIDSYSNGKLQSYVLDCKEAGDNTATIKTTESIEMYESVKKYEGFYVARFEAGISPNMPQVALNADTTNTYANGIYKPVSKQNAYIWNYIKWGGTSTKESTDNMQGNDKANGAVKVARSMYNSLVEGNKNTQTTVKSTLIYGVQWDAIMNFIDSNYLKGKCSSNSFVRDSTGKGNYASNIRPARAGDTNYTLYAQKNIIDIGGNVLEWTFEAYASDYRIGRGGNFFGVGIEYPSSRRYYEYPDYTDEGRGFRIGLYI